MNRAISNVTAAVLSKAVSILGAFAIRTVIIYTLGNEYVGLNSLFVSILSVLSLAELGFGSALTFMMYGPVNENDTRKLCELLNFYKIIYRTVALIILGLGLVLTLFLPKFISGTYPSDINIYLLFWIYLLNTVLSYAVCAYRSALLIAHQRNDMTSLVHIVTQMLMYGIQIAVILIWKNYYAYAIMLPCATVAYNLITNGIAKKKYPDIAAKGKISDSERRELLRKIKALFVHRVTGITITSVDNIIISVLLGLNALAVFSNYYYIANALIGFVDVSVSAIISIIGNKLLNKTRKERYELFIYASRLSNLAVAVCTVCLFNLYQPFMGLWVGEKNLLSTIEMTAFCVYFFAMKIRAMGVCFRDAAGLWRQDVVKSLLTAVLNVVGNIILVRKIGVTGSLVSTIILMVCLCYPWETAMLFRHIFKRDAARYVTDTVLIGILTVFAMVISHLVIKQISVAGAISALIFSGLITIGVVMVVFGPVVYLLEKERIVAFANRVMRFYKSKTTKK